VVVHGWQEERASASGSLAVLFWRSLKGASEWIEDVIVRRYVRGVVDNLTPAQRRRCMARIRSTDTGPELRVRRRLHNLGLRFRIYATDLPGKPDIVFPSARVVVFIDGDFWHGWQFPKWRGKLSAYWQRKIDRTRARDSRNMLKLRRRGWKVIRLWEHNIERDEERCIARVMEALRTAAAQPA